VGILRHVPKIAADLMPFDCCNVIVATMSVLAAATSSMLADIASRCTHLFLDEAHHSPAHTWSELRKRFADKPILQFTATPFRRDGRRLDGKILYNYPLSKAQSEGYFQSIRFEKVWEWDEKAADKTIADAAVRRLREDIANGFDHILMARTDSIDRAGRVYLEYEAHRDLNPVVIHNGTLKRKEVIESIKARKHRIIVCVDMLGEGFDLPQLKVAALHDAHRSLGVTLQFAGRFTRTSKGIGQATIVANLADRKTSESLEELYSEDADWNRLLPDLSFEAIRPQANLSEFVSELKRQGNANETEILAAAALEPKTSTVVYTAQSYRPQNCFQALPHGAEIVVNWLNPVKQVTVLVTKRNDMLGWARTKDVTNTIYDLYLFFFDEPRKLLFIHSSVKASHLGLAKAVGGPDVEQLKGENVFRVLDGLQRLMFYNAGLLRSSAGAIRFQMFAGLDVAKAIDPVEQEGATKSNLFGSGYEGGRRVTIGCSQRGTLWSQQTSSIPEWREWCQHIGGKLVNGALSTTAYLEHTLVPELITSLPAESPFCMEWPSIIFERMEKGFEFWRDGSRFSWLDCGLELANWDANGFTFVLALPDGSKAEFQSKMSATARPSISETVSPRTEVKSAEVKKEAAAFFEEHPPLLRFSNGTELIGNVFIKPRSIQKHYFPVDQLEVVDWTGVDITKESKWKNGVIRTNSVQHLVIQKLLADPSYAVVFDDDDKGEAADVIAIKDVNSKFEVHLFHCKFSSSSSPGSRADALYVVCGQAQKGVMWTLDFGHLAQHITHRERKSLNGRPTRFERGTLKELSALERASRKTLPLYTMTVVQPAVSKASFNPTHSPMLGATSVFLRQRINTQLKVWVSS
jgi:hypothetical protein